MQHPAARPWDTLHITRPAAPSTVCPGGRSPASVSRNHRQRDRFRLRRNLTAAVPACSASSIVEASGRAREREVSVPPWPRGVQRSAADGGGRGITVQTNQRAIHQRLATPASAVFFVFKNEAALFLSAVVSDVGRGIGGRRMRRGCRPRPHPFLRIC